MEAIHHELVNRQIPKSSRILRIWNEVKIRRHENKSCSAFNTRNIFKDSPTFILKLVNLNMPLLCLFQSLQPLIIVDTFLFCNTLEHILDARHHSLQTTKVYMRTFF